MFLILTKFLLFSNIYCVVPWSKIPKLDFFFLVFLVFSTFLSFFFLALSFVQVDCKKLFKGLSNATLGLASSNYSFKEFLASLLCINQQQYQSILQLTKNCILAIALAIFLTRVSQISSSCFFLIINSLINSFKEL